MDSASNGVIGISGFAMRPSVLSLLVELGFKELPALEKLTGRTVLF